MQAPQLSLKSNLKLAMGLSKRPINNSGRKTAHQATLTAYYSGAKKNLCALFLDVKKAFDSIDRKFIFRKKLINTLLKRALILRLRACRHWLIC